MYLQVFYEWWGIYDTPMCLQLLCNFWMVYCMQKVQKQLSFLFDAVKLVLWWIAAIWLLLCTSTLYMTEYFPTFATNIYRHLSFSNRVLTFNWLYSCSTAFSLRISLSWSLRRCWLFFISASNLRHSRSFSCRLSRLSSSLWMLSFDCPSIERMRRFHSELSFKNCK